MLGLRLPDLPGAPPLAEPENGETGSPRSRWSRNFSKYKYGKSVARLCCRITGNCRQVVAWHAERDRGKAGHRFEEEFEIAVVRLPLAAPCQTLASQQEKIHVISQV